MAQMISIGSYFKEHIDIPVIDVRSPKEYAKGHIPRAVNIALFSDEERHKVGTCYKQVGREEAVDMGYTFVNPKLDWYISQAEEIAPNKTVAVHCWRGGMRSQSFADHLLKHGFKTVFLIEGGYKAYRNHLLNAFSETANLKVVGGYTGSGKTAILKQLAEWGHQVIDLEGLAKHRGSAFGGVEYKMQPTVEQFENNLFDVWRTLNLKEPIYIEDESHNIGRVRIPMPLYTQMRIARLLFLDMPRELRAEILVNDYASFDNTVLHENLMKISKRLGGVNTKQAEVALAEENYIEVARITLVYYDKYYKRGALSRGEEFLINIPLFSRETALNSQIILDAVEGMYEQELLTNKQ